MEPSKLIYTETHEWVSLSKNQATVGITDHAQKEISDVVFVELAKVGQSVKRKESVMVIESVKAAFDIYAPLSGRIIAVNEILKDKPELVNQSPLSDGWLFKMEGVDVSEAATLLSEDQYKNAASHSAH